MQRMLIISLFCFTLLIVACSKTEVVRSGVPSIHANTHWMVFPFANLTATPDAGSRAKAIVTNLINMKHPLSVRAYHPKRRKKPLLAVAEKPLSKAKIVSYATSHHINYAVVGTVTEWRYKVGLDGEPSVGITMQLLEIPTGRVVWSAVGSKVGSSRSGLAQTAQSLIQQMIKRMPKLV